MVKERIEIVLSTAGTRTVKRNIDSVGRSASNTRKLLAFMRSALVVLASVRVLGNLFDLIDSFSIMQSRIRLVTSSQKELLAVQTALLEVSQRTSTVMADNVNAFFRVARATLTQNLSFKDLIEVTETLALAQKIFRSTTQESASAMIQLGQGLAAGAIQGQELRSIVENLPPIADAIAREFGIAGGALIALNKATPGIVTAEVAIRGIMNATAGFRKEIEDVTPTFQDAFNRFNNALLIFTGNMSASVGITSIFAELLDFVALNLDKVALGLLAATSLIGINLLIGAVTGLGAALISVAGLALAPFRLLGTVMTVAIATPIILVNKLRAAMILLRAIVILTSRAFLVMGVTAVKAIFRILAALSPLRIAIILVAAFFANVFSLADSDAGQLVATLLGLTAIITLLLPIITLLGGLITAPFLIGAVAVGALVGLFFLFKDSISAVTEKFTFFDGIIQDTLAFLVAGVRTIINKWDLLPAAMGDIAIRAVNFLITSFGDGITAVINLFNKAFGTDISLDPDNILTTGFKNQFVGAAAELGKDFNAKLEEEGAIDQTGRIFDSLASLKDKLKSFLPDLTDTEFGDLLSGLPKGFRVTGNSAEEATKKVKQLTKRVENLLGTVSPLAAATRKLDQAQRLLNDAQLNGVDVTKLLTEAGLTQEELLKRIRLEIAGVGNAETDYIEKQQILHDILKDFPELGEKVAKVLRDIRIEMLDTRTDFSSGVERAFLKLEADTTDIASQIEDSMVKAFKGAEDALFNFVLTGKLSFKSLIDSIIKDLIRLALKQALLGLFTGLFGGLFSGDSSKALKGVTKSIPGFAKGGITSGPEFFPMGNGGIGLRGEGGSPEAIMPIGRDSHGNMGVVASGTGGDVEINIKIDARGAGVDVDNKIRSALEETIPFIIEASANTAKGAVFDNLGRRSLG